MRTIADRATARLEHAGERAVMADDHVTASGLLLRARGLASESASRGRIGAMAATSLFRQQRVNECIEVGEEAVADATAAGDQRASTNARLTVIGARFSRSEMEVPALSGGGRERGGRVHRARRRAWPGADRAHPQLPGFRRGSRRTTRSPHHERRRATPRPAGDLGRLAQSVGHIADSYVFGRYPVGPAIEELERALPRTRAFIDGWSSRPARSRSCMPWRATAIARSSSCGSASRSSRNVADARGTSRIGRSTA